MDTHDWMRVSVLADLLPTPRAEISEAFQEDVIQVANALVAAHENCVERDDDVGAGALRKFIELASRRATQDQLKWAQEILRIPYTSLW